MFGLIMRLIVGFIMGAIVALGGAVCLGMSVSTKLRIGLRVIALLIF